jgi:serine/threonine protein kinase
MSSEKQELMRQCSDLLATNPAKMNINFIQALNLAQLRELHHQLNEMAEAGKLSTLTKAELHAEINPNQMSYFYRDKFANSQLMVTESDDEDADKENTVEVFEKKAVIAKGKNGEVHQFVGENAAFAVKYSLCQNNHFHEEYNMALRAGTDIHFFSHPEKPRLVSHFVEGKQLIYFLKRNILSIPQWLDVSVKLANALIDIHKSGVVHNDLTPFNVLVDDDLNLTIIDYGEALDDISLKFVDIFSYSKMMIKKFNLLQTKHPETQLSAVIDILDQALDAPTTITLESIVEAHQQALSLFAPNEVANDEEPNSLRIN